MSLQDLQKSLSSQGSPSISPAPFGSHMTTSSGADANSPALSQNSAPSSTPSDPSFHPSLGSGSLARQLARPAELDRVSSGYLEPGELLLLLKKVLLLKKCCHNKVCHKKCCYVALQVCHACCYCPAFVSRSAPCLRAIDTMKAFVNPKFCLSFAPSSGIILMTCLEALSTSSRTRSYVQLT